MQKVFIPHKFNRASLELLQQANTILNEYRALGYKLSLRQLYYQLVARDIIPNSIREYKRVGSLVSDARNAGEMDWEMIEDRNRESVMPTQWQSPAHIIRAAASQFEIDRWQGQKNYVEVMVEKDALSGILEPVCRELHVRFTANKGYSSSSAMFEAGLRFRRAAIQQGRACHLLYFGDHDPSGIDMTRDVLERLQLYSDVDEIEIKRLALNWDQIEMWRPPENPAKETDSRFEKYKIKFGEKSWELDAVEPRALSSLVRDNIREFINRRVWNERLKTEKEMKAILENFADEYEQQQAEEE